MDEDYVNNSLDYAQEGIRELEKKVDAMWQLLAPSLIGKRVQVSNWKSRTSFDVYQGIVIGVRSDGELFVKLDEDEKGQESVDIQTVELIQ